ncbi:MAG: hypothetical protein IKM09_04680 [Clostridia bacterium]|nr:hypothetical protein [Clostridia bacterium]
MKKRILAGILVILTVALSFPSAVLAEEKYQPSLYLADNVWYKDKSQPLVIKSSNSFYVPAEAFDILPDVTLTKNEELGAILLTSPKASISIDTNNGTVILPNEDKTISVITENGNLYVYALDICAALSLSIEVYSYSNGQVALRLNDSSGMLPFPSLVKMFVSEDSSITRLSGPLSKSQYDEVRIIEDLEALQNAVLQYQTTGVGFFAALDAEFILGSGSIEFYRAMRGLFATDLPFSLFSYQPSATETIHFATLANKRLLELFHKGTLYITPTCLLDDISYTYIYNAGFTTTDFSFSKEAE